MIALLSCFLIIIREVDPEISCSTLWEFHTPNSMQLSEKRNGFSQIFVPLPESASNFKHFEKKMIIKANVFPNLQTVKNLLRDLSKKRRFGTRFDSQHAKAYQILVKSPWECFYFVFSSFSLNLIWKMSQLVLVEIFLMSVKTLAADGKYFVQDCENLPLPIQIQLSEK